MQGPAPEPHSTPSSSPTALLLSGSRRQTFLSLFGGVVPLLCVWILTKPLPSLARTSIIKASNSRKVPPKKRFSTHHAACQALFFHSASLHPSKYISASSEANKRNRWQPGEVVIFFLEGWGVWRGMQQRAGLLLAVWKSQAGAAGTSAPLEQDAQTPFCKALEPQRAGGEQRDGALH